MAKPVSVSATVSTKSWGWWDRVFLTLVLLSISYLLGSVLRRRYKKKNGYGLPPGPLGLPILGHLHLLGDLPHRSLHKLANKFGPIMSIRLGLVPTIVVSSPEAAELVLKTHDHVFASRPKSQAAQYLSYGQKNIVFAEYGSRWRNLRKMCTLQLLTSSKIESTKSMRTEYVKGVVRSLVDKAEARKAVYLTAVVGSVIQDITFGMITGGHGKDRFDLRSTMEEMAILVGAFNLADYIPFVGALDIQGLGRSLKMVGKVVDGFLERIIDEHIQNAKARKENDNKDFIDVMLSLLDEELDRDTMKAVVLDMLGGALDTSSTAIEWILSELLKHPRVMKQVQSELDTVVGMNRMVDESDLMNLEYLDSVLKESMRLHPVGPLLVPHESMEDIVINGYHIPKKSRIIVNTWAIGRDPEAWSASADEFYPERFIGVNIDFCGNDLRFLPFGSGRRGCPGVQLGLRVVRLVVAQLVHCFNWELPDGMSPGDLDMTEKFGLTVPRASHLLAKPTFRLLLEKNMISSRSR